MPGSDVATETTLALAHHILFKDAQRKLCGRLEGTVAILTGAGEYLGKSHCIHLARQGAKVVVTDIVDGKTTVDAVKDEGRGALFMKLDVTSWGKAQCLAKETVERFGRIDILVNNARLQTNIMRPWTEFTADDWDRKLPRM